MGFAPTGVHKSKRKRGWIFFGECLIFVLCVVGMKGMFMFVFRTRVGALICGEKGYIWGEIRVKMGGNLPKKCPESAH